MYLLTVFTPTYNRRECLKECYRSLCDQTNKDFIWQIVDDGSTDGTGELIASFIKENKVNIDYHWKENGGKASAINYSLEITTTPLWVCLDSDDYLFANAVEIMLNESREVVDDFRVCGVFAVRSDPHGAPMKNVDVPDGVNFANQLDIRYKYHVPPEYVQVYKTEIIKQYPFPLFAGEKFVTESWMQDQIDQKYVFKVIHEPLMVCEYLPDGLTNNYYRLIRNNPRGFLSFYGQRVRLCKQFKQRIIAAIMYNAVYRLLEDKTIEKEKGFVYNITEIPARWMQKKIQA